MLAGFSGAMHPAQGEKAQDARNELSSTLSDIKLSGERQKELARKTAALREELNTLEEQLVAMGRDTSRQEEDLSSHEESLAALEQQKKEKAQSLEARQAQLSAMVSAMVKLQALPPEAVIAMPGKLGETLETSRALSLVTHAIEEESQKLKIRLREIDALETRIRQGREVIAVRKTALSGKQAELAVKIRERAALVERLGNEQREERERAARLTARSHSLQELLDSLKKAEAERLAAVQEESEQDQASPTPQPERFSHRAGGTRARKLRSFVAAQGHIALPASGRIVGRFGDDRFGQTFAKGMTLATREGANVLAPFDGEVVFAGTFRDYGRMVILRHSDNYHTLLSGMQVIDCKPGQYVIEGEPIGTMGGPDADRLYMELREDGKPVDPADWLRD